MRLYSSLRARLLLLVLMAVIPALGLIAYTAAEQQSHAIREGQEEALRLVRLAANTQQEFIDSSRQLLLSLARLPEVRSGGPAECSALLAEFLARQERYANLGVTNEDGVIFCSALSISQPVDASDRVWFQRAVQTSDFAVGEYQIGRITGMASINFGYPILDDMGRVQRVVFAALGLEWLNQFAAGAELPEGSTLAVIDRNGTVLVRQPDPEIWVGQSFPEAGILQPILDRRGEGIAEAVGLDGVLRLYAFAPLGGGLQAPDVYVYIGIPKSVVLAPANRTLVLNLIGLGLVALLALEAAWVGGDRFLLRPIKALVSASRRLAAGDLGARTALGDQAGEVGQLARAFDQMAESLQQNEQELHRVNRALRVLSESNQSLVRATDESGLLQNTCRIIVEKGRYRLAWVGYAEQDENKTVRPVAQAGYEDGYLKNAKITWAPTEQGQGPTGTAIRTGKPSVAQNILADSKYSLWREKAMERGYASSIALPLIANGRTLGALSIYAAEPDSFDEEEVKLLSELADDLAYGIISLRARAERERAEKALKESESKFRDLTEKSLVGVYLIQEGVFKYVNPKLAEIFGYEVEGLIDRKGPQDLVYPEDWPTVEENLRKRIFGEMEHAHYSFRGITKDKKTIDIEVYGSRTVYQGKPAVVGTLLDVTDRRRAEERIQRQLQRITSLRNIDTAILGSLDLRLTLNIFLEQVSTQLGVDAADILLFSPHTLTLEYADGRGFRTDALKHTRLRLGEGHAGRAALERRIVSIPNMAEAENGFRHSPLLPEEGFVSYFAVPLLAKGQVKGVLEIFHRSPLDPDQEWLDFLETLAGQAAIAIDNATLFDGLQRSHAELTLAYDATIEGWSRALDLRDKETEGHTQRVTETTLRLARRVGMREEELVHVRRGAMLHDMGKMGIPDSILLKPGPLTKEEWVVMKKHPVYAYEMLSPIAYLRPALDVPYCHHEKWDGSGYPRGLKGEEIPLAARIFAIVDVWDALRSDRPYRKAWPEEKALEYIKEQAGKHFDPALVPVFLEMMGKG